ncbi:hypothetical protein HGL67_003672 [Escherichia coli]|uniref:Uncharacterized protein n=1 Tax=Escherichia marmotae TaxID=1499973 RepID=A0A7W3FZ13_9ESCH|nr:hypothetical protein [Escherichia marmotae]EFM6088457.1 hypothetical protein [Escherichia coli]EFN0719807.1 hypothetical protein [Escherichia coli]EGF4767492.1 hypothetical protein [Escherichia coli]MBA7898515.1 hypothetical protein [Escherichia marmotae]QLW52491.1 hypothetical protein HV246_22665 [Escherichia marmotae]
MASKNKIIVHIGDEILYSVIENEIKACGCNKSEFIRNILEEKFKDKIAEAKKSLNNAPKTIKTFERRWSYPLSEEIELTCDWIYSGKRHRSRMLDGRIHGARTFSELYTSNKISGEYTSVFLDLIATTLKELKEHAKKRVENVIPDIFKEKWNNVIDIDNSADINLIFINKVDVKFLWHQNNEGYFHIDIWYQLLQLSFESLDDYRNKYLLRLDLLNIKYLRFKEVATKKYMPTQYERLYYIKTEQKTRLGGFFVGLFYSQRDKKTLINEIDQLILKQDNCKNKTLNIPGRFVKLHIPPSIIKIDHSSFHKAFEILKKEREQFQSDSI